MANYGTRLARIDVLIGGADQAKKQVEEMRADWKKLSKEVDQAKKAMEASVNTVDYDKNKEVYEAALKEQKLLQKSIRESERAINTIEKYLQDVSGQTLRNLNNAQRGLKQMLLGVNPKNVEMLSTLRDYIKQVGDEIQRRKGTLVEFSDVIGDIGNVSDKSLGMAKKRLEELISSTKQNVAEMQKYQQQLKQVEEEEQRRISAKAGRVMGNLDGSSVTEIQEAIKLTTQLRDAQKLGSQEWEIYNEEIDRANKYLSDFEKLGRQLAMADRMRDLGKASEGSLAELKKYWQEQVNGAERGSQELAEYEKHLHSVMDEEKKRAQIQSESVMRNLQSSSVSEIQNAIKVQEQLRDATNRGSTAWSDYNKNIEQAKAYLDSFSQAERQSAMADRMRTLGNASADSLAELKKFWQEQVNGAEMSSSKLQEYQRKLKLVIMEEKRREDVKSVEALRKVQSGAFSGTIGETKEAIQLLEKFKQGLNTSNVKGVKEVEDAITQLKQKLKEASGSFMSLQDALTKAKEVGDNTFDGTREDLEKLKKTLEEYKKSLDIKNVSGLKDIEGALDKITKKEKEAAREVENIDEVISELKTASLDRLQRAAAQLQEELSSAVRGTKEYVNMSRDLRMVNEQIDEIKHSWKEHDNQIVATIKRLTSYVLVYAGFNEVWGRIKELYQANLELSDSMADIQKTTQMSAKSVAELSKEIDGIDTRTAQKELHDLAYEAGKLGISAKEDVLAFVKAGNQLLVALGEDLGGAEAVRRLMKVNAVLGETQKLGVEKALLATGSAINEISQTSRASAGPIVDVVTRIGAIGNAAGLSMSELVALAGSLDALGQNAEVGGTALNTFISTLTSETTAVAQAVGLNDEYLKGLINQGRTIEAVIAVFEKMKAMGSLDVLSPLMKDLGSDGERIKQVLVTLSSGVDELKAQVFTSSRAFEEATSVTDEYNIKNESAMAIVQRMGNSLKESFVNSGLVEWLTDVLKWIDSIPNKFKRGEIGVRLMAAGLKLLIGVVIATSEVMQNASLNMQLFIKRVKAGTVSLNVFKTAFKGFVTAMKMNPLGWLTIAISAASAAWGYFSKSVSDAGKEMADFQSSLEKEIFELNNLRYAIDKANKENGEKAALIKQLNDKYGAYLGFMVTEQNYAEKQEYIYRLINERLRENLALKMRDKMMENIVDKYSDQIQELNSKLIDELNKMARIGETNAGDAMNRIIKGIKKAAREGLLPGDALDDFFKKYDYKLRDVMYGDHYKVISVVEDLLEIEKKVAKESKSVQIFLDGEAKSAKEMATALMELDLKKYSDKFLNTAGLEELGTYAQQATNFIQRLRGEVDGLNKKRSDGEKLTEQENIDLEEKKNLIDKYTANLETAQKRIKALGMDSVWGQGITLETAGVDKLVAVYEKLETMMKSINEDKDYADAFSARGFKSAKEEYKALQKMEEDVAKVLKDKWGRDTSGNWLKERKGGRGWEKDTRDEINAAISALDAYFLRRQQVINQAFLDEEITSEERNRRLDSIEEEHLLARIELRKKLLGRDNSFDKEMYGMGDKDLDKLAAFLKKMGDKEVDGMAKNLEAEYLRIMEIGIKYRQEIEKELMKYNPFEVLVDQFETSLDKIRLLSTDAEKKYRVELGLSADVGADELKKRAEALADLAADSYAMNEDQLKEALSNIDAAWALTMSPNQVSLMLKKLRDFYQQSKDVAEKYAQDIRKMIDIQWNMSGKEENMNERIKAAEEYARKINAAGRLDLTSNQSSFLGTSEVDNAELEALRIKLEKAQQYYDEFHNHQKELIEQSIAAGATEQQAKESFMMSQKEAMDSLDAARQEYNAKEMEVIESKLGSMKKYTDAVVDFSGQMGEAAFGEVEDRKAAAKMLLQTAMKLTKDLIMQKVQELVMKKALASQEVAQEAATSSAVTIVHGQQAITDMTVQGAKTAGDVSSGIASGSAKTIGQLGWWGMPLIALISAALSGLMGLAMGKLNKAKEEVSAATGVSGVNKGRVAAGMLTYAEGDYPVLGNDGQVYNARYQKELKTGVYGGGAHFGIFSEKKPEMIVDGDTTQKLILNYPGIYESILTIARHGQLKQAAMPTFASGSYPSAPQTVPASIDGSGLESNAQMMETLSNVAIAVAALTERLNHPINATVDPYGRQGAVNQLNKANRFMQKRGLAK